MQSAQVLGFEHEQLGKAPRSRDQSHRASGAVLERHHVGVSASQLWPPSQFKDPGDSGKQPSHAAQVNREADQPAAHRHRAERVLGTGEQKHARASVKQSSIIMSDKCNDCGISVINLMLTLQIL